MYIPLLFTRGGGGGHPLLKMSRGGVGWGGGVGATSYKLTNGDVLLDGVAFSQLD